MAPRVRGPIFYKWASVGHIFHFSRQFTGQQSGSSDHLVALSLPSIDESILGYLQTIIQFAKWVPGNIQECYNLVNISGYLVEQF